MSSACSRRLGRPGPVQVVAGAHTTPVRVDGIAVESILEEWVVENGWWTEGPLRRRYFELVLADGRDAVVFRDLSSGRWYRQRA